MRLDPHDVKRLLAAALLGGALLPACDGGSSSGADPQPDAAIGGAGGAVGGAGGAAGGAGGSTGPGQFASQKSNLRFKDVYRLKADLARAMKMPAEALCSELGQYDCFDEIHTIGLNGVDAYEANIYEAPEGLGITAPMIIDRVMLSACTARVDRDAVALAPGGEPDEGAFYVDVALDGGRLADIDSEAIAQSINRMYTRAYLRQASEAEIGHLRDLYRQIEASPDSEAPARDWGILACYSVFTSVEFLFY